MEHRQTDIFEEQRQVVIYITCSYSTSITIWILIDILQKLHSSWEEQVVTIFWTRKKEWMVFIAFHNFLGWPKNMWYLGCQLTEINVLIRISHLSLRFLKRSTKRKIDLCATICWTYYWKHWQSSPFLFFLTIYRKFFRKQTYLNGNFIVLFI